MRITPICLAALLLAPSAHAAGAPQVTDPRGDANFSHTDVVTDPASFAAYDVTSVRWWHDAKAQRVTLGLVSPDRSIAARYVLYAATPACDSITIQWEQGWSASVLTGCLVRQVRTFAPPAWSASGLTFTLPPLPSWLAKGTALHGLGAEAGPTYRAAIAETYPQADTTASSTATYVLGT